MQLRCVGLDRHTCWGDVCVVVIALACCIVGTHGVVRAARVWDGCLVWYGRNCWVPCCGCVLTAAVVPAWYSCVMSGCHTACNITVWLAQMIQRIAAVDGQQC